MGSRGNKSICWCSTVGGLALTRTRYGVVPFAYCSHRNFDNNFASGSVLVPSKFVFFAYNCIAMNTIALFKPHVFNNSDFLSRAHVYDFWHMKVKSMLWQQCVRGNNRNPRFGVTARALMPTAVVRAVRWLTTSVVTTINTKWCAVINFIPFILYLKTSINFTFARAVAEETNNLNVIVLGGLVPVALWLFGEPCRLRAQCRRDSGEVFRLALYYSSGQRDSTKKDAKGNNKRVLLVTIMCKAKQSHNTIV